MDITGIDKAEILAALYNNAKPQGIGHLNYKDIPMDKDIAEKLLKEQTYFDYLKERVLKVDLSGDELNTVWYNRYNGKNAAENIIYKLRLKNETI